MHVAVIQTVMAVGTSVEACRYCFQILEILLDAGYISVILIPLKCRDNLVHDSGEHRFARGSHSVSELTHKGFKLRCNAEHSTTLPIRKFEVPLSSNLYVRYAVHREQL